MSYTIGARQVRYITTILCDRRVENGLAMQPRDAPAPEVDRGSLSMSSILVFDSLFLQSEYLPFLSQTETIPGVAGSVKANFGAFS